MAHFSSPPYTNEQDGNFADRSIDDNKITIDSLKKECGNFYGRFGANLQKFKNNIEFLYSEQWDAKTRAVRSTNSTSTSTVNLIYPIVQSHLSRIMQASPDFKVYSAIDESQPNTEVSQDQLTIVENYLRHLCYENNFNVQQQTCASNQVLGYGAYHIYLDYENEKSFKLKPFIEGIKDINRCYWDLGDKSDFKTEGRYAGILDFLSREDFYREYPHSKHVEAKTIPSPIDSNYFINAYDSQTKDFVQVANHYKKIKKKVKLYMMNDGSSMTAEEAKKALAAEKEELNKINKQIHQLSDHVNDIILENLNRMKKNIKNLDYALDAKGKKISRNSTRTKIIKIVFVSDEILEEEETPFTKLPLVFVDCNSYWDGEGKQSIMSYFETAKDAQKIYNYVAARSIQMIINSPSASFIGTPKNVEDHEDDYKRPDKPVGVLLSNRDESGQLVTPYQPAEIPNSYANLGSQMMMNIQNSLGYINPNDENAQYMSGDALNGRIKSGQLSVSFLCKTRLALSSEEAFKIILDVLPYVMEGENKIIVRDRSGRQFSQEINTNPSNTITSKNFNVQVEMGDDYASQLMENQNVLMKLVEIVSPSDPNAAKLLWDPIVATTNCTNTPQLVDRIREYILGKSPQQILQKEMGLPEQPLQPDPAMQMQQQEMQMQQQNMQLEQSQLELEHEQLQQEMQIKQQELQIKEQQIQANREKLKQDHFKTVGEIQKSDNELQIAKFEAIKELVLKNMHAMI